MAEITYHIEPLKDDMIALLKQNGVTYANPEGTKWFTAREQGRRLLGVGALVLKGKRARLKSLAVLSEKRGMGIGSTLVDLRIRNGYARGGRKFDAYCAADSQNIYLRNGFSVKNRLQRPGRETWIMERNFETSN